MTDWNEIRAWRKARRAELIARRDAVDRDTRRRWNERISALLERGFPMLGGMVVGFCWPYKGEFDARFAIRDWRRQGATAALPEVVAKGQPLRFRTWWPGAPMAPGVYGIPVPQDTEVVVPDVVLAPMNGFDESGCRLGYGGGYFDRTLAALAPRPLAVGVAFEIARLATIFPQRHDIPMDFVVTEEGIHAVGNGALAPVDAAACGERAARLLATRGLPRRRAGEEAGGFSSPPCYAHEFPGYFGEAEEQVRASPSAGRRNRG
ncbi:MAG: 5-formyltetrahydrofolate cyclo-ligase [Betaproteobacteria bacterium]|nr:5-formyltetrahydrofolate cyclo-ligase [Betaproteobacteria bacterium]